MGFGEIASLCSHTPLPMCPLVGAPSPLTGKHSTLPQCYARTISLANTIIFEAATGLAHISALSMIVIMIIHVRTKFTAVGESFRHTNGRERKCNEKRWKGSSKE